MKVLITLLNTTLMVVFSTNFIFAKTTLYKNANIITINSNQDIVNSMIVKDGKILEIGNLDTLSKLKPDNVVDMGGKTIIPGFYDSHSHMLQEVSLVDYVDLASKPIGDVKSIKDIQNKLKNYLINYKSKNGKEPEYIIGYNYNDASLLEKRHPTQQDIINAVGNIPTILIHFSSHGAVVSKSITDKFKVPNNKEGQYIEQFIDKDSSGNISGYVKESAVMFYASKIIKFNKEERIKNFKVVEKKYLSYGITTANEALLHSKDDYKLYSSIKKDIDINILPLYDLFNKDEEFKGLFLKNNALRMIAYKDVSDGSIQLFTAALKEKYHTLPFHSHEEIQKHEYGVMNNTQEFYNNVIMDICKNNTALHMHTNGDRATEIYINAIENLKKENVKCVNSRFIVIHGQLVTSDLLKRISALKARGYDVSLSLFPSHIYYLGDFHKKVTLGDDRASRMNNVKDAMDMGIITSIHNDSPVFPNNMFVAMYSAIARKTYQGDTLGQQYKISPMDAIKDVTINAAYQGYEEKTKGSLEAGKIADFIVISDNILKVSEDKIKDIKVLQTYKNGKLVYSAK